MFLTTQLTTLSNASATSLTSQLYNLSNASTAFLSTQLSSLSNAVRATLTDYVTTTNATSMYASSNVVADQFISLAASSSTAANNFISLSNSVVTSLQWSSLSTQVNYTNLGIIPAACYSNIPVAALGGGSASLSQWTTSSKSIYLMASNVGIGTSTPTSLLQVAGTLAVSGVLTASSDINCAGAFRADSIFSSTDVTVYSDSRLKKDLIKIPEAGAKIKSLVGYTFTRADAQAPKRCAGLIAQDVMAVLPEAVHEDPNTGLLSVAYGNVIALLVEGIKELQDQVSALSSAATF
jgi:hypothetical protein